MAGLNQEIERLFDSKGCINKMQMKQLQKKIYNSKWFSESWFIAYRKRKSNIIDDKKSSFTIIENAPNCWAADPFVIEFEGKTYIFAELYEYKRGRGVIGYYNLDNPEKRWEIAIIEPYHLSYPHLYRKGDDIYIIPEANESKTLYCYRAINFPNKWEKLEPIRRNVRYVDTSIFEWKNAEYALAYKVKENGQYNLVLLDFDDQNNDKVIDVTDIDLRRPGGKVCSEKQIRVAQNCREGYGKGLIFYHFDIDQHGQYTETEIGRLFSEQLTLSENRYLDGIHTYNLSDHYEVIDIKTRTFSLLQLAVRVKNKMKKNRD